VLLAPKIGTHAAGPLKEGQMKKHAGGVRTEAADTEFLTPSASLA